MRFADNIPIYIQIKNDLLVKIFTGIILRGEKLMSIRESAQYYEVNPNTIVKVYEELKNEGLIYTERTNGKFVTVNTKKINEEREKYITQRCGSFLKEIKVLGIGADEITEILVKEYGKI